MLPSIKDTDSNQFYLSLAKDSPKWIQVEKSTQTSQLYYILIDTSSQSIPKTASNISATLFLSDDSGAFTSYILNIEFLSTSIISFQQFKNIEIYPSTSFKIPLDIGNGSFSSRLCGTQENISWICYSRTEKALLINDADK